MANKEYTPEDIASVFKSKPDVFKIQTKEPKIPKVKGFGVEDKIQELTQEAPKEKTKKNKK